MLLPIFNVCVRGVGNLIQILCNWRLLPLTCNRINEGTCQMLKNIFFLIEM